MSVSSESRVYEAAYAIKQRYQLADASYMLASYMLVSRLDACLRDTCLRHASYMLVSRLDAQQQIMIKDK